MHDPKTPMLIGQLDLIETALQGKDFLLTWEQDESDLRAVLLAAEALEELYAANTCTRVFESGLAVSIFRDQSTRTRFSFAGATDTMAQASERLRHWTSAGKY